MPGGELNIFDQEPPTPKAAAAPIIALFSSKAMFKGLLVSLEGHQTLTEQSFGSPEVLFPVG
jgi:hypothetical protein